MTVPFLDFNKALEIAPRLTLAYYFRAGAYYNQGEYGKSWDDVHKLKSMGFQVNQRFLKVLREASGRGR